MRRKIKGYFECTVSFLKNHHLSARNVPVKLCFLAVSSITTTTTTTTKNSIVQNREHKERSENWSVRYCGTGNRRFHLWKRVQKSASQGCREKEHEGGCPEWLAISKPASSRQTSKSAVRPPRSRWGRVHKGKRSKRELDARRTRHLCHNSRLWPGTTVVKVMVNH